MGYPHLKTTTNSVSINKDCNRKIFTQSVLDWNMLSIYIVLGDSMTIVQLLNVYLNLEFAAGSFISSTYWVLGLGNSCLKFNGFIVFCFDVIIKSIVKKFKNSLKALFGRVLQA